MSVPHTGRLVAQIGEHECRFDGDRWTTPDPDLTSTLDGITAGLPKHHIDIRTLAEWTLKDAGLADTAKIVSWESDDWGEELPGDAMD